MVADVIAGHFEGDNYPTGIYIPQDDKSYLSKYPSNPNLAISTVMYQRLITLASYF